MKPALRFQGVQTREYPLDRPVLTIGRHQDHEIVGDHMGVSGMRARVAVEGSSVILADLRHTNGAFVNHHRTEQTELRPNDWITIGRHILSLKAGAR